MDFQPLYLKTFSIRVKNNEVRVGAAQTVTSEFANDADDAVSVTAYSSGHRDINKNSPI